MGACHVGFIPVVLFLCGRYLRRSLLPLSLALTFFTGAAWANPPGCTWYTPPTQKPTLVKKYGLMNWGGGLVVPYNYSSRAAVCAVGYYGFSTYGTSCVGYGAGQYCLNSGNPPSCLPVMEITVAGYCDSGYTLSGGVCVLNNADLAACPTVTCTAGTSAGSAVFTVNDADFGSPVCYQGCMVDTSGVTGGLSSGGQTTFGGDFKQSGATCAANDKGTTAMTTGNPPGPSASPKYNCVTASDGSVYCENRQKPGCGTVNGKEYCADQFSPTSGTCVYFGKDNFVCSSSNPPTKTTPINPPTVAGQSPPSVRVRVKLPGDGVGGTPGDGPGGWTGNIPANGGDYNGTGNGQDPGGDPNSPGNKPTDPNAAGCGRGDACESTQQAVLSKLGEIKDGLSPGSGSYDLAGFGTVQTYGEAVANFKNIVAAGPLGQLAAVSVSDSGGSCPTYDIPVGFLATSYTLDAHCTIASQWGSALATIMMVFWAIIALRIFFSA